MSGAEAVGAPNNSNDALQGERCLDVCTHDIIIL